MRYKIFIHFRTSLRFLPELLGRLNPLLRIKRTLIVLVLLPFVCCTAQADKKELKVLFVGNSYTYYENLPQIISIISDSMSTKIMTKKSVSGGSRLSDHWYSRKGLKTKELIKNGDFDIVVLQEQSMGALKQVDSLKKYMGLFSDYIRNAGATPYMYQTWAREKTPNKQLLINIVFKQVALENNSVVVPVGEAWQMAKKRKTGIVLYDSDGSHPARLGTFLTACVFVEKLLGHLPENMAAEYVIKDLYGEDIRLMYIDPPMLEFCKNIVSEVVAAERN